jgi:ankyrin repeat protein
LIGFGADVNARNIKGETPIHLLLSKTEKSMDTKTLRALIFKGAERNIKDNSGLTAIERFLKEKEDELNSHN